MKEYWLDVSEENNFGQVLYDEIYEVKILAVQMWELARPREMRSRGPWFRVQHPGGRIHQRCASDLKVMQGIALVDCYGIRYYGWERRGGNWYKLSDLERLAVACERLAAQARLG